MYLKSTYLPIYLLAYLPTYGSTVLSWTLAVFQFCNPIHSRTPRTGDQPVARPLPTHRTTQIHNKRKTHSCLEWDSNPLSKSSRERRQFIPQTARPL
jgi:hypothetical protein